MTKRNYWLTPPNIYENLNKKYGEFNFDPCPYPLPSGFDGTMVDWGTKNYVNPPFSLKDAYNGKGITAFVHKAIIEQNRGNDTLLLLPVNHYVALLIEAGATVDYTGRVKWLDTETNEPQPAGFQTCAFYLKGNKKDNLETFF